MNDSAHKRATPIPHTELLMALELFLECHRQVVAQREEPQKIAIQKWIDQEIVLITPAYSLREDALGHLFNTIFTIPTLREYVLDLSFLFFTLWGVEDGSTRLSMNVAEGLSVDGFDPIHSGIPEAELASMSIVSMSKVATKPKWWQRLLGQKPMDLPTFLANNKSLLVVYLLYLTHTNAPQPVATPAEQPAQTPRNAP